VSLEAFGEKEGFQNYYGPGQITRDREGLLWIGGDNGLYSFDGTYFTNYRRIAGNDSSLPSNVVTMNYQDSAGNYGWYHPIKDCICMIPFIAPLGAFVLQGYGQV